MSDDKMNSDGNNHPGSGSLDERLARLPAEVAPVNDLWSGIAERIADDVDEIEEPAAEQPGNATAWRVGERWYAMAAAVLFASVTGLIVLTDNGSVDGGTGSPVPELVRAAPFETEGLNPMVDAAQLMQVRTDLHHALREALAELAPETRLVVIENLAQIELARAQIDSALKDDPQNQLLQQLLLSSYTSELSLLNQFSGMARSAQQRTVL